MVRERGHPPAILELCEEARVELARAWGAGKTRAQGRILALRKHTEVTGKPQEKPISLSTVHRLFKEWETEEGQRKFADIIAKAKEAPPPERVPVRQSPEFKKWAEKIRLSRHFSALHHLAPMEKILTGKVIPEFTCSPANFTLAKAQEYVRLWQAKHPDKEMLPWDQRSALRGFLQVAKEISIPRGFGVYYGLSGEKPSIGLYAHIHMTREEIELGREPLLDMGKPLLLYDLGIEFFARTTPLLTLKKDQFRFTEAGVETSVWEEKTDVAYPKYLLLNYPHARETAEELKEALLADPEEPYLFLKGKTVHSMSVRNAISEHGESLRRAYKAAGKTDSYFYRKPFYSLRHIGAQLWLERTDWDYALVAEMGWKDISTLRTWYGRMPASVMAQKIEALRNRGGG